MLTITFAAAAIALANPLQSQTLEPTSLGEPLTELGQPFTSVRSIRELSDGRVLVADTEDQAVYLADFERDDYRMVGRNGSGPGEYQLPLALLALPSDSSLIFDPANGRYLVINPDGSSGTTFRLEELEGFLQVPGGSDGAGRLYFSESSRFGSGSGEAVVFRFDRGTRQIDTLAQLDVPAMKLGQGSSGGVRIRVNGASGMPVTVPFQARDAWAVSADGRVAVARSSPYRVEWYQDSDTVSGPEVTYTPVRVTDADEQAAEAQAPRATIAMRGGSSRSIALPVADRSDWPDHKPPFRSTGLLVSPAGELWLPRYQPAGAEQQLYDVFGRGGERVRQVLLPAGTSLVGFGARWIYLVRTDEDGLNWLGRYRED